MRSKLQKIMREQGLLCRNCGEMTRDGLCGECQIEFDETEAALPVMLPTTATMNELKAKALTVLTTAKRLDLISWPREKAFAWFREQAVERGIAPQYQDNFVNAVASLYLQSLG